MKNRLARSNAAKLLLEIGSYDETDLKATAFSSSEALSELFSVSVSFGIRGEEIELARLVGQEAHFSVGSAQGTRGFHGLCVAATFDQRSKDHFLYTVTLAPRAFALTQRTNCRIFQEETVEDIVRAVFTDHGIGADELEFDLGVTLEPRAYCVQYAETDFAFVARILAEEGLWFRFREDRTKSIFVVSDRTTQWGRIEGDDQVNYSDPSGMEPSERRPQVFDARLKQGLVSNGWATRGYGIERPHDFVDVSVQEDEGRRELFEPNGTYVESAEGEALRDRRYEAVLAEEVTLVGQANALHLVPGEAFELGKHPVERLDGDYHVTRIELSARLAAALEEEASAGIDETLVVRFTAIPAATPYRPAEPAHPPRIEGTQLGLVVGSNDAEIETDEYGRVKVRFRWDRYAPGDDTSSCWIRVAQPWAGSDFGFLAIPRVGQEVLVDFLDGDPNQPIIVGSVYNGEQRPPQALAENQSRSTWRSRSLGGSGGFNEITLDDKESREEFYLHAERNLREVVKAERTRSVGTDESVTVGANEVRKVGKCQELEVGEDRSATVGGHEKLSTADSFARQIGADETRATAGKREVEVALAVKDLFGKTYERSIADNCKDSVGAARETVVVRDDSLTVGGNLTEEIAGTAGRTAMKIEETAATELKLSCGAASLTLKADGTIELRGTQVTVNGSASLKLTSTGVTSVKGSMVKMN